MAFATNQKTKARKRLSWSYISAMFRALTQPSINVGPSFPAVKQRRLTPSKSTQKLILRGLLVGVIFFLVGALWIGGENVKYLLTLAGDQAAVSTYLKSFGVWSALVLFLVHFIQVLFAFIPGHVFLISAGYVYGLPLGILLNLFSVVLASQVAFLLARWAGRPLVNKFVPDQILEQWYEIGEKQGFVFFMLAFWLPVFPADAMNFVAGLSGISSRKFLAANFLGRLPGVILLTLIGSHGFHLSVSAWVVLVVVCTSFYIAGRYCVSKIEQRYIQNKQENLHGEKVTGTENPAP